MRFLDIRVVHFFDNMELSTATSDTNYLVPNRVEPPKKSGPIISKKQPRATPKVYVVPVCTDEGGKSNGFSIYLVKLSDFDETLKDSHVKSDFKGGRRSNFFRYLAKKWPFLTKM